MEVVNMRENVQNEQSFIKKQTTIQPPTPPPPTAAGSPPSAASSPTHEFSFTVSLHPHPPPKFPQDGYRSDTYTTNGDNENDHSILARPPEPLAAIDLSPADDIFFHGHLLPLHLLSHLPISPRSSTNSMDSFTLPIKDILNDHSNPIGNTSFHYHHRNTFSEFNMPNNNNNNVNPTRPKAKSFSLFGRAKWKKESQDEDQDQDQDREKNNNNSKKKLTQLIKRYMKMVRPLLSFQKAKRANTEFHRQPHSFSGNLMSSRRSSMPLPTNRRRGEFSAPVSMRTSPANSGILLASGTISPTKSTTSDSTMEELQAAIQAAIAHCKNSIAMEDKIQTQN